MRIAQDQRRSTRETCLLSRTACLLLWLALFWPRISGAQTNAPDSNPAGDDYHALGDVPQDTRPADAQPFNVQTIFRLANQDRAAQGLTILRWSPELANAALAHARLMVEHGELSHRYPGEADLTIRAAQAGAHFSSVAENIALGSSAEQLERAWMRSPPHRANILDPRIDSLGVAVIAAGGTLYAVQDFAASVALLSPDALEGKVEAALRNLPADANGDATGPGASLLILDREEARRHCNLSGGLLPGSRARFVMRWQASDLTLPQQLVDALRSGRYPAAAVGACEPSNSTGQGFMVYRLAVLLY